MIIRIMKQWHFYDKVYRRWVVLFVGDFNEFKKELEINGFNDMDLIKSGAGMCVELNDDNHTAGQNSTLIWLRKWELTTLVHEITHLVMMAFCQVDVPISRENTESFAFYTEFWYSEITKGRRKYPKGNKPKDVST